MIKQIIPFILIILVTACISKPNPESFEHTYMKYWEKYSSKELVDTLFSDTLHVGIGIDNDRTPIDFYIDTTSELIADIKDDKNSIDSLYPMIAFNEMTIRKLPLGLHKTFTNEQSLKFLEIINDPVSFDWGETTYEAAYRINFLKNTKVVASLTLDIEDMAIIKTEAQWPYFKKMKFGKIRRERYQEFVALIKSIDE